MKTSKKTLRRSRIKRGIRRGIVGSSECPRLTVFRSNKAIYAQIIDDQEGKTLVAASSIEKALSKEKGTGIEIAKKIGVAVAEKAKKAGIAQVLFDRNGYLYHGRVKALAEGAREGGLKF